MNKITWMEKWRNDTNGREENRKGKKTRLRPLGRGILILFSPPPLEYFLPPFNIASLTRCTWNVAFIRAHIFDRASHTCRQRVNELRENYKFDNLGRKISSQLSLFRQRVGKFRHDKILTRAQGKIRFSFRRFRLISRGN